MPVSPREKLEGLWGEISQRLEDHGIDDNGRKDWRADKGSLFNLVSRRLRPIHARTYARRLEFVLKQMLAIMIAGGSVREGRHVALEWMPGLLVRRITEPAMIPDWVDDPTKEIRVTWNKRAGDFVYGNPPATARSLDKGAYRINSRHARLLGVQTYGQHPQGGHRF